MPRTNQTCDYKSHSRFAVVRFCNHARFITDLMIYMKTFLNSDWLRAGQFVSKYSAKKWNTVQKTKYIAKSENNKNQ
jgi:hypothetical protein